MTSPMALSEGHGIAFLQDKETKLLIISLLLLLMDKMQIKQNNIHLIGLL